MTERERLQQERRQIVDRFHAGKSRSRNGASMELRVPGRDDDAVRLRWLNRRIEALR
jgi:hypothetical protein